MDHSDDPADQANQKPAARTDQQIQQQAAAAVQPQQQAAAAWSYQQQQQLLQQQQYAQAAVAAGLPQQQAAAGFPPPPSDPTVYASQRQQQQHQQLLFQRQQEQIQLALNQQRQQILQAAAIQQQQQPPQAAYPVAAALLPQPFLQAPRPGRLPAERPLIKLSVSLIDTYKNINNVYYENRDARRAARGSKSSKTTTTGAGANNNGWDDENYDYIITAGELFYGRYKIKERIGKGSFGQVVRAEDIESHRDVAIKIIKSKKPFLLQAKTEIELLTHLWEKDPDDQHNIGRLDSLIVGRRCQ